MKKIILITSLFFIFGCSSRKVIVDKNYIKKDSSFQIFSKINTKEIDGTKIENNIVIDEFEIVPLDSAKEIIIDNKHYKNVILRHKKTKDNSLYLNNKIVSKIEDKQQKSKVSETKKEFKKQIDKKSNYFIYLLLIIIIYIIWQNRYRLLLR